MIRDIKEKEVAKKKVLFTSEDGKDIFEGDRCWYVNQYFIINFYDFNVYSEDRRDHDLKVYSDYKYFSTEDKANDWVNHNKPCLSLADIESCYKITNVGSYGINLLNEEKLKELVKEKINNK